MILYNYYNDYIPNNSISFNLFFKYDFIKLIDDAATITIYLSLSICKELESTTIEKFIKLLYDLDYNTFQFKTVKIIIDKEDIKISKNLYRYAQVIEDRIKFLKGNINLHHYY